jgi:hypothetical protein
MRSNGNESSDAGIPLIKEKSGQSQQTGRQPPAASEPHDAQEIGELTRPRQYCHIILGPISCQKRGAHCTRRREWKQSRKQERDSKDGNKQHMHTGKARPPT